MNTSGEAMKQSKRSNHTKLAFAEIVGLCIGLLAGSKGMELDSCVERQDTPARKQPTLDHSNPVREDLGKLPRPAVYFVSRFLGQHPIEIGEIKTLAKKCCKTLA